MIIKNFRGLSTSFLRKDALEILNAGVESVLPERILKNKVSFDRNSSNGLPYFKVEDRSFELQGNLHILGFGKASAFMAKELEEIIGEENIYSGAVIDNKKSSVTNKILVYEGDHPLPTQRNLIAGKNLVSLTTGLKKEDLVVCLISGGGSALFTLPPPEIPLDDVKDLTSLLLKSGAEVFETNILRKHLSQVKGGKLINYLHPAEVVSLIFSDTIDTTYDSTASGPTSPDKSTFEDACTVLEKYNLLDKSPKTIRDYLENNRKNEKNETLKPENPLFKKVHNFVLADNTIALSSMKKYAESKGYKNVEILSSNFKGESRDMALKMAKLFKSGKKGTVYLYGGETTVSVQGNGKGGRLQEYLAALIPEIQGIEGCVAAALGSDGTDYLKGIGGAIIDNNSLAKCFGLGLDPRSFINESNTYELHNNLESLIKSDPTNTNVADLHVFIT